MKIIDHNLDTLSTYTALQCKSIVPMGDRALVEDSIAQHLPETIDRLQICINACSAWAIDEFDVLQSSQYCTYLYFLANTIWKRVGQNKVSAQIFLLNKSLNAIDLFYEINMPSKFFISHSVGTVFAKATYGEYLVVHQNCTIGRHGENRPTIGERVVIYPNSAVIGSSRVGDDVIISQGTSVIDKHVPAAHLTFPKSDGQITLKPHSKKLIERYFRF